MRSTLAVLSFLVLIPTPARAEDKTVDVCLANFEEAQLKEKRGKLVEARELFASCAAEKCPAMVRGDCGTRRDRLDKTTPSMTIVLRDGAGHDVDASITIDGKPLVGDRAHALPIDPGAHVVTYTVAGKRPVDENVTVYEGEQGRVLAITVKEPARSTTSTNTVTTAERPLAASEKPSLVGPLVVGGIGAVAVLAGVGAHVLGAGEESKSETFAQQANDPRQSPDDSTRKQFLSASSSRHDAAATDHTVGWVLVAGGAVLLGGAALWYFLRARGSQSTAWVAPGVYRF